MTDIQIVFIVLKLIGAVTWSWGVVFVPLWISLIFYTVMFIAGLFS